MTTVSDWLKLSLHHPPITSEAVSELLFSLGALSLWEDAPDDLGRLVTRAGFSLDLAEELKDKFPLSLAFLAQAFELEISEFSYDFAVESDRNWAEKWKEGLAPVVINQRLALAPTWWNEGDLPKAEVVLRLDPGLAFGSGHHHSTQMALKFLADLDLAGAFVLDVGAGSGILSLAAAAMNPEAKILGVDQDQDTIAVAWENAATNGFSAETERLRFSGQDLPELTGPYDLILANITLDVLSFLAPGITKLAACGSLLILSGLLTSQVTECAEIYSALGWEVQRELNQDEWASLLLRKGY